VLYAYRVYKLIGISQAFKAIEWFSTLLYSSRIYY